MKSTLLFIALFAAAGCASKTINVGGGAPAQAPFVYQLEGAPKPGSAEDQKDYETLLALQKSRTLAECARGVSEVKITLGSFYGPPYGPLTAKEVASLSQLFSVLSQDAWPLIGAAKDNWKRPRPYLSHKDLTPCAKKEPSFSYPSGHSAISHYYMHILTELFPERKEAIEKRAEQIAVDRTIVGIHYPTDIRDGKILGDQIYEYLAKNKKFEDLIREGQREVHQ